MNIESARKGQGEYLHAPFIEKQKGAVVHIVAFREFSEWGEVAEGEPTIKRGEK